MASSREITFDDYQPSEASANSTQPLAKTSDVGNKSDVGKCSVLKRLSSLRLTKKVF